MTAFPDITALERGSAGLATIRFILKAVTLFLLSALVHGCYRQILSRVTMPLGSGHDPPGSHETDTLPQAFSQTPGINKFAPDQKRSAKTSRASIRLRPEALSDISTAARNNNHVVPRQHGIRLAAELRNLEFSGPRSKNRANLEARPILSEGRIARGLAALPHRDYSSAFTGGYYNHAPSVNQLQGSPFATPCASCDQDTFWAKRENFIFGFVTLLASAIMSEALHQVRVRREIRRRRRFDSDSIPSSSSVSSWRDLRGRRRMMTYAERSYGSRDPRWISGEEYHGSPGDEYASPRYRYRVLSMGGRFRRRPGTPVLRRPHDEYFKDEEREPRAPYTTIESAVAVATINRPDYTNSTRPPL